MEQRNYLKYTGLLKKNYRGKVVPAGVGIIFVIGSIMGWVILLFSDKGDPLLLEKLIFLTAITGGVGLLDDLQGSKEYRGFNGHLSALFHGIITTGFLKATSIFAASFIVLFTSEINRYIIIDGGIIILMSHFHNLLDLRPGRTLKFFILFSLIITTIDSGYSLYLAPVFIITIFYLYFDLKAKMMLGDTGSYVLGIILGFMAINVFAIFYKILLFAFLLLMTVLAEKYSFSEYIKNNRFLNWLDMLGRNKWGGRQK